MTQPQNIITSIVVLSQDLPPFSTPPYCFNCAGVEQVRNLILTVGLASVVASASIIQQLPNITDVVLAAIHPSENRACAGTLLLLLLNSYMYARGIHIVVDEDDPCVLRRSDAHQSKFALRYRSLRERELCAPLVAPELQSTFSISCIMRELHRLSKLPQYIRNTRDNPLHVPNIRL